MNDSTCTRAQLSLRLRTWFDTFPEPATLVFDYSTDWDLLIDALLGDDFTTSPVNVGGQQPLAAEIINDDVFQKALNVTFTRDFPPHHALADARAIMAGYRAWRNNYESSEGPTWVITGWKNYNWKP